MYLKDLSQLYGASGNEEKVKDYIKDVVKKIGKIDYMKEDHLGNLMCFKKGKNQKKTLLVMAHMDEVGLMVSKIEEDGKLNVFPVGGVDVRVLLGKRVVVGEKNIDGIIPFKAIHLQKKDYKKIPDWNDIKVDIGAKDKKEAESKVNIGDFCHFRTLFEAYKNRYVGKAFDDRAGCAIMLEILEAMKELPPFNVIFAFVVQEENGLRGSGAILKHFHPDAALIIEGTTAGDNPELKRERWSTHLDSGPAISYLQSMHVIDRRLFKVIVDTAESIKIPYQIKGRTVGGTDAGRLARSFYSVPGAVVSTPARYIHSPVSVMSKADYEHTHRLVNELIMTENYLKVLEV
ncbi:MAG: M42 family metallopeptidase [Thermotogota bacterium]